MVCKSFGETKTGLLPELAILPDFSLPDMTHCSITHSENVVRWLNSQFSPTIGDLPAIGDSKIFPQVVDSNLDPALIEHMNSPWPLSQSSDDRDTASVPLYVLLMTERSLEAHRMDSNEKEMGAPETIAVDSSTTELIFAEDMDKDSVWSHPSEGSSDELSLDCYLIFGEEQKSSFPVEDDDVFSFNPDFFPATSLPSHEATDVAVRHWLHGVESGAGSGIVTGAYVKPSPLCFDHQELEILLKNISPSDQDRFAPPSPPNSPTADELPTGNPFGKQRSSPPILSPKPVHPAPDGGVMRFILGDGYQDCSILRRLNSKGSGRASAERAPSLSRRQGSSKRPGTFGISSFADESREMERSMESTQSRGCHRRSSKNSSEGSKPHSRQGSAGSSTRSTDRWSAVDTMTRMVGSVRKSGACRKVDAIIPESVQRRQRSGRKPQN